MIGSAGQVADAASIRANFSWRMLPASESTLSYRIRADARAASESTSRAASEPTLAASATTIASQDISYLPIRLASHEKFWSCGECRLAVCQDK